jgi:Zn finger protein HypA/HybF involved in hydrogenase expression
MALYNEKDEIKCGCCDWTGLGYQLDGKLLCPECGFATHLEIMDNDPNDFYPEQNSNDELNFD